MTDPSNAGRGPTNDAPYDTADTQPGVDNALGDTAASGEPSGHAIPDDGRDAGVNGADLAGVGAGDRPAGDAPTLAGDAVGAAAGSALEDEGPDGDTETEVGNQQRPF